MSHLYLVLDAATFGLPFLLSFDRRVGYYRNWIYLIPAILVSALLFIIWDVWFTRIGVWGFNPDYLMGVSVFGLPLEEVLFFFVVPYACVFIYECMKAYFSPGFFNRIAAKTALWLGLVLIIVGAMMYDQLYTATAFIGCGTLLLLVGPVFHKAFLGRFFQSYLVVLVPFLLINGVLTGTGIEGEVVWYSPAHIFGVRIATIPVEDAVYGMFLLLITTTVYEYIKSRAKGRIS